MGNSNVGLTVPSNRKRFQNSVSEKSLSNVSHSYSTITTKASNQEVQKLLQNGAIFQTAFSKDEFYSRLFLIPKKDGTIRTVIDLSTLNTFVGNSHFHMEILSSIKSLLRSGNFMTKLDLQDAYLTEAMDPLLQKFRWFIWKDKVYQSQALPSGLNVAPRVFTKLLKLVAAFLRKKGIPLVL